MKLINASARPLSRWIPLTILVALGCLGSLSAQQNFPSKDLAFGQVPAGGGYESVLTFTNRSVVLPYSGRLYFYRSAPGSNHPDYPGSRWFPIVNGTPLGQNNYIDLQINPDQTLTVRVTAASLQSGAAILRADDLTPDNYVEGHLTYHLRNAQGVLTDSVGIQPSTEFYLASLPFERFGDLALALANPVLEIGDQTPMTVGVRLSLIDSQGNLVAQDEIDLGSQSHLARFLTELFPPERFPDVDPNMGRGKLEVVSEIPIFGTALTFIEGELSSLPLNASPVGFTIEMDSDDASVDFTGLLSLWAEGYYVRGQMVVSHVNGIEVEVPTVTLVNGQLIDGFLDLAFLATGEAFGEEVVFYLYDPNFSFSLLETSGTWVMMYVTDPIEIGANGTLNLTRTTP